MNENTVNQSANFQAWAELRDEIAGIGCSNPLMNFEPDPFCRIDLDRAHPGGMAQFTASGSSTLSNLVRDPLAFSRAHAAARRIDHKTHELRDHFGIETCYLVGGLANLEADGFDLNLPILMWPLQLVRKGDDYEVHRTGEASVNPALIASIEACYGVKLDERGLLGRLRNDGDLVPIALLDHLSTAVGTAGSLDLKRILSLGNFTTVPTNMLRDVSKPQSDGTLLKQLLAGGTDGELGEAVDPRVTLPVLEADEVQRRIVARAVAGQSFAVETLPGCGYTQTVVNLLSNLAFHNKRVLVVAPRRQTLNELADRIAGIGLGGLFNRSHATWMDSVNAISRNEKSQGNPDGSAHQALAVAETKVKSYFDGLSAKDQRFNASIIDVLEKLAELAAMPHAPVTNARIDGNHIQLPQRREEALELLTQAHVLGEFKYGPLDSAWFQSRFESPSQVEQALATAKRLRDDSFPNLAAKLAEFIAAVEFKPANSVAEFGVYLRLFEGIRESLDRFVPSVFDRSLTEVIAATSPRKVKGEMSGGTRRRLKKLAKEFVRPGMHIADLNLSLKQIEDQREAWAKFSNGLKQPTVTPGINDALVAYQALLSDLDLIQRHLDPQSSEPPLAQLPLDRLKIKLNSLVEDVGALENLSERAMIANKLREMGLESLTRDLARIHVSAEHIAAEYDLAWWQTALEALASANASTVAASNLSSLANEQAYRDANTAVLLENRQSVIGRLGENWKRDVLGYAAEASALKANLRSGKAEMAPLFSAAPKLMASLAPVVLMSPYEVATSLPASVKFDAVVVLDAAGTTLAENLSAVLRAKQLIAFGDNAVAHPTGFELEARPVRAEQREERQSMLTTVANLFGNETLRRSYRQSGQILGSFINREFYQNRIVFEPTADDYFHNSHIGLEIIHDGNAASTTPGSNESPDSEVHRAIEIIFNHALWHPEDSLLVATASQVHADRIRAGVIQGLKQRTHLLEFFEGHGRERFEVSTLSDLTHRVADHVIFSVGFGKTPLGGTLSDLGDLSTKDGRRGLANLLVSARKQITVISCFSSTDLSTDDDSGIGYLRDLLMGGIHVEEASQDAENDAMLADLAIRLRKLGVTVKLGYGRHLPLVASYGNRAAAVIPDWNIAAGDLYQEVNLMPVLLKNLGWNVHRVFAFELFADPEKVARDLAESLGLKVYDKSQSLFDDEVKFEDTDAAWGERPRANDSARDAQLKADKPPHWG